MKRPTASVLVLSVAGLLAQATTARALPAGPTDYELAGTPAAIDLGSAGGAWTVESLGIRIDFDRGTVALIDEFRLGPDAGGPGFSFNDANVGLRDLDIASGTVTLSASSPDGGAFITGEIAGVNGEQLLIDFSVNNNTVSIRVVPDPAPIRLEADLPTGDSPEQVLAQLNAGRPGPALREGDAVNAATGNLYRAEHDVPPAGPAGLGFTRHYNSRSPLAGDAGWLHEYGSFIDFDPPAFDAGVLLVRPDGRGLLFHRTGPHELATGPAAIPADVPAVGTDQYPLHWTGSEWRYRNDTGGLEYYDDAGRLLRLVGRNGLTRHVERDAAGRIAEVHDDFGRALRFEHDGRGRLVRLEDPAGSAWRYGYDAEGRLVSATGPHGTVRTYHYGESGAPAGALTSVTDAGGNRHASWQYDGEGRVVAGERAGGVARFELEHLADGGTRVVDAAGGTRVYGFTRVRGRLLAASIEGDACAHCGKDRAREYDALGLVTRAVDRNGNLTTYQYNAQGLETSHTEAAGTPIAHTVATEWDPDLRRPRVVTEPGRVTEYDYDARGRLLARTVIDPGTGQRRTTARSYHPDTGGTAGQLAAIDGPRTGIDDVTRFEYDGDGNRVRTINALGHVTTFSGYDAFGRPLRVVGPNGLVTTFEYDRRGRLLERDTGGEVTRFDHDATGNLVRVARADGSELRYEYDPAGRLVSIADEQGNRIDYVLDAAGNRIERNVRDASGVLARTGQQAFDELNRPVAVIGAGGQTTTHAYDANGNRTVSTDPLGDVTRRAFDALDRVVRVTDPLGGITSRSYDVRGHVASVTDPNGNTTRIEHDGFGNRTAVDSPDSGTTTQEYDAAGNVVARTDARGRRAEFAHDALGRMTRAEYADGTRVDYYWDEGANGIGRLSRAETAGPDGWSSAIEWAYDAHGRVTERRQTVHGVTLVTRHAYDSAGRRIRTVYPSGRIVSYGHDADDLGDIAVDGEPVISDADYAPFGPVSGWTRGDGDVVTRHYDLDGRLVQLTLAGGVRAVEYSADGNIAAINGPEQARSYAYDGLDRLVAASEPGRIETYAYDANGNRISRMAGADAAQYTIEAGSNRLLAISGSRTAAFAYDADGNLVEDGEHSYGYDGRDRLLEVDGGATAAYRYNALGERIYKRAEERIDYLALAQEAAARADAFAAGAGRLQHRARQAARDAAEASRQAAEARAERNRARARLEQAEAGAALNRRIGGIWQNIAGRFAGKAERLRERIVEPARRWWQRLRNAIYRPLASVFQRLADYFAAKAETRFARAEAADERAVQAQIELARAQTQLAGAEQAVAEARARADRLRGAAQAQRQQAAEQRHLAASYRRLAEEGATRTLEQRFVHDEAGRLLGRYTADGTPVREYVYLGAMPVAVVADGLYDIHTDHLGTPRALSRPDGTVIWRWDSGPFGVTAPDEDPDGDGTRFTLNLRFPGQYFDAETGRHHESGQTYDPVVGRHVNPGPGSAMAGRNRYVHAANNPLRFIEAASRPIARNPVTRVNDAATACAQPASAQRPVAPVAGFDPAAGQVAIRSGCP